MSRGLGKVQREILHYLSRESREHRAPGYDSKHHWSSTLRHFYPAWMPVGVLAEKVFSTDEPTRAQVESVRRAAKSLASAGEIELSHEKVQHQVQYQRVLCVRPVLSAAERDAQELQELCNDKALAAMGYSVGWRTLRSRYGL
jgi:hypothetical protein